MNPFRFLASSPRRFSTVRNHPRSTRLRIESLEQRRLLAIDTLGAGGASPWQNGAAPADVNADGHVSAQDAMLVINELNAHGSRSLTASIGRDAFLASTLRTAANTADAGPVFLDTNGDGMLSPQDVALIVNQLNETAEPLMQVRLEVTDAGGNAITQVNVNDSFQLRAFVLDLRTTGNTGVFSAFTDVTYNSALASAGSIVHASDYVVGVTGNALTPDLLNEVGGTAASLVQLGPNERLLFTVQFTATAAGALNFMADPADSDFSDMLLYDMNPEVPVSQVMYGADLLVVSPPDFSIADVWLVEGSSGMTAMEFTVTLSDEYEGQVSVQYALQAATATSDIDFLATSGTLTFDPGQVSKTFTVEVLGDTLNETNETFLVNLTNPSVGTLADAQATGTITDDDPVPTLSINTPTALPENAGVTPLVFTVTLSAMSGQDVVVHFSTADVSTIAGQDYTAQTSGMLTIPAGQLTNTIDVGLLEDTADEADQTFTVTLSDPTNATIAVGQGTGTILDNDATPTLSIAPASVLEGNSGTTDLVFTVTLSAASDNIVSVTFKTEGDTASEGEDYDAGNGTLTIMPGDTSGTITINVRGDTDVEADETFRVVLSDFTNASIGVDMATGTIQNDDSLIPTVSIISPPAVPENAGPISFTVMLSAISGQDVVVRFKTDNGTAIAGQDYVAQADGMLTIPAGQLTGTIAVGLLDDTADERDQQFTVTLLDTTTGATLAPGQATGTGTILDNDDPPILTIASPAPIAEGNAGTKSLNFTVTLSAASDKIVSFTINTEDGTAFAGQDYVDRNETLTIAAGQTSTMFAITINGDGNVEQDETFGVRLSDPTNATIAVGMDVATGTITNDDLPTVSISSPAAPTTENDGPITFTVMLSAISSQAVVVRFKTDNGTAIAGQDYVAQADGMLTIPAGQLTGTINVGLLDDTADEPDQQFTVTLLDTTTGATLAAGQATGTGTILDNDAEPTLSIAAASVMEGNSGVTPLVFTVTLSAASDKVVSVTFITAFTTATEGEDYDAGNGTLTIMPGQVSRTIPINVRGDVAVEANETFRVDLSDFTNAAIGVSMATGTITNDDLPSISIADASITEGDSGATQMVFTVTLDRPNPLAPVSVQFQTAPGTATSAVDFLAANGTLTFDPNETTKTIAVDVNGDTLGEPNETFVVNLTNPSGGTLGRAQATGTIVDNETVPMLSIGTPVALTENAGITPIGFTVTLSQVSSQNVTVNFATANGTAIAGQDFTAPINGMLTIPAGEMSGIINVSLRDDTVDEPDQTFTVTLSMPTNATIATGQATATGTILDDDAPPTVSIASPAPITEGNTGTTPLVFTVSLSAASQQPITVAFHTVGGSATEDSDYNAAMGTLTFAAGATTTTQTITVNVRGDNTPEDNQTFSVVLSDPTNASIPAGTGTATGTINDDDGITITAPDTARREDAGVITFTVRLSVPSAQEVKVDFTTMDVVAQAGKDYTAVSGTLTFAAGVTSQTISVPIINDLLDESDTEELQVVLSNSMNMKIAVGSATGSITDNDNAPSISIGDASVIEGDDGTTKLVFTATLSAPSGLLVTADFHTTDGTGEAGTDYTAIDAAMETEEKLTFLPGTTTATIMIDVHGDRDIEPDETVQVVLTIPTAGANVALGRATATGTILDDDHPTFAGFVYNDLNRNGMKDPLETGIAGVLITLSGMDSMNNPVNLTQTTGADGFYRFSGLMPGDYMVVETHPQDYTDGAETPGGAGITSSASDQFMALLAVGDQMENNNFGEYGLKPEAINKTLLFASMRR